MKIMSKCKHRCCKRSFNLSMQGIAGADKRFLSPGKKGTRFCVKFPGFIIGRIQTTPNFEPQTGYLHHRPYILRMD